MLPCHRLGDDRAADAGHIPTVHDYKPSGRGFYHQPGTPTQLGRDYVFSSPAPLWAFGFGLSYTAFSYETLTIETPSIRAGDDAKVSFTVRNTGARPARRQRSCISATSFPR